MVPYVVCGAGRLGTGWPRPVPGLCVDWPGSEQVVQPCWARLCLSNGVTTALATSLGVWEQALCNPHLLSTCWLSSLPDLENVGSRLWILQSLTFGGTQSWVLSLSLHYGPWLPRWGEGERSDRMQELGGRGQVVGSDTCGLEARLLHLLAMREWPWGETLYFRVSFFTFGRWK